MRHRFFLFLIIALFFGICIGAALAAPETEKPKAPEADAQKSDDGYLPAGAEGAGPYETPADGGLGIDLWQNTPHKTIENLVAEMPASSKSPAMQKLIFGILLSKTDTGMIKSDAPPDDGRDLLTLRLNKLIEGGAYRQALDLYSSLQLANPPQSVAHAGILAMLYSGEKSLACLEMNTVKDKYGTVEFFKTIAAYCDVALSDKPSDDSMAILKASPDKVLLNLATQKDFMVNYTPADFEKYSALEKAMIAAEGRLQLAAQADRDFKDIPPAHIQLLMKNAGLTDKDKFVLNTRALGWGLISAGDYKKVFLTPVKLDDRKDPALAIPESAEDWQKLPYYFLIATNKKDDGATWSIIRDAFPIGRKYGLTTLTPLAELIYKTKPEGATFEEMKTALLVLNRSGYMIPAQWIETISNYTPAEAEKADYSDLLAAAYLSAPDDKIRARLTALLAPEKDAHRFLVNYIIENVDKLSTTEHTAFEIYENPVDLTFQNDYVMPSMGVLNRLPESGKEGHIGETVLLVATAFRGIPLREIHPGLFRDALGSLKSVGLTDISGDLAVAAILGSENDLKEN